MVNQLDRDARAARLPGPVRVESPLVASSARRRARSRSALLTLLARRARRGRRRALRARVLGLAARARRGDVGGGRGRRRPHQAAGRGRARGRFASRRGTGDLHRRGRVVHLRGEPARRPPGLEGGGRSRGARERRVRADPRVPTASHALLRRRGAAPVAVSNAALEFALDKIANEVDRPAVSAALVRRGLRIETVPSGRGRRSSARPRAANASSGRSPRSSAARRRRRSRSSSAAPAVTARMLAPAARRARRALGPRHGDRPGRGAGGCRAHGSRGSSPCPRRHEELAIAGPAAALLRRARRARRKPARDAGLRGLGRERPGRARAPGRG